MVRYLLHGLALNKVNFFLIQTYRYQKPSIPEDEGKLQLCSKLLSFGVSLKDYQESLIQDEITP